MIERGGRLIIAVGQPRRCAGGQPVCGLAAEPDDGWKVRAWITVCSCWGCRECHGFGLAEVEVTLVSVCCALRGQPELRTGLVEPTQLLQERRADGGELGKAARSGPSAMPTATARLSVMTGEGAR